MRNSFEDLYAEALLILGGRPSLQLSDGWQRGLPAAAAAADPTSVLARLSGASSASSGTASPRAAGGSPSSRSTRPSAASVAASSAAGPASYPLPLQRPLSSASGELLGPSAASLLDASSPGEAALAPPSTRRISEQAAERLGAVVAALACPLLWALAVLCRMLRAALRAELEAAEALACKVAGPPAAA